MQSFSHKVEDLGYTPMAYSDFFSFSGLEYPQRIELALNVSKLEMGINDGSVLGVMLELFIDDVSLGDIPFKTINLDENGEIHPWIQIMAFNEGDDLNEGKDPENSRPLVLGNRGRFRYFLSQADQNGTPSKASFDVAVNVK